MKVPVAHVEAGLRSYDLDHPFPEEEIVSWFHVLLNGILPRLNNQKKFTQ